MKPPIFLISSERSGSNLIRVIAGSHPQIAAPAPPHLLKAFFPLLASYGNLSAGDNFQRLCDDAADLLRHQSGDWESVPDGQQYAARSRRPLFPDLLAAVYEIEAEARGKSRFFVKDNGVVDYALDLLVDIPDAKFVYLVRDPRDMALSWLKSLQHVGGVATAARVWAQDQRHGLHLLAVLHDRKNIHVIHYEDLVSEPENTIRRLCLFLEEEFDEAMLNFHQTKDAKSSAERLVDWSNLSQPMIQSNFRKYRGAMSPRQIRKIESIAHREMRMLGYPLEYELRKKLFNLEDVPKAIRAAGRLARMFFRGAKGRKEMKVYLDRLKNLRDIQNQRRSVARQAWSAPAVYDKSNDAGR